MGYRGGGIEPTILRQVPKRTIVWGKMAVSRAKVRDTLLLGALHGVGGLGQNCVSDTVLYWWDRVPDPRV